MMEDDERLTVWEVLGKALRGIGYKAARSCLVQQESGHFALLVDEVTPALTQLLANFPLPVSIQAETRTRNPRCVSPAEQHRRAIERVGWLTPRLRTSADPHWVLPRRLLIAESIDVDSAWLAEAYDEDVRLTLCVVVTASGEIYELEYKWNVEQDHGTIRRWHNITHTWFHEERYYVHQIAAALELAGAEVPASADLHL